METINYDQQAAEFLDRFGIRLRVGEASDKAPPWADGPHGYCHRITLSRDGRRLSFYFWGSINDANLGKRPTAYDVLACIGSDLRTFEEFCGEYGYDEDSRKALDTFKRVRKFADRLAAFFATDKEREALAEIQ